MCLGAMLGIAVSDAYANGRITFTGNIFQITQPGQSLKSQTSNNAFPSEPWMLSGSWRMEIDPDILEVTLWEHNMIMLRSAEREKELPADARGNPIRDSHTVQLELQDGKVRSLNFMTGLGRITGTIDTLKNGEPQFTGDEVEILLTGGRGFEGMTNLEIRFVTDPDTITNVAVREDPTSEAKNARQHFGEVILGTVRKISVAE